MPDADLRCTTTVCVRELGLLADIGINPDEIGRRQPLVVSVELTLDAGPIDAIDAIDQTIDYRGIAASAEALAHTHIPLIETFAQRLAEQCLRSPRVAVAHVSIDKPFALTRGTAGVVVTMRRPADPQREFVETRPAHVAGAREFSPR